MSKRIDDPIPEEQRVRERLRELPPVVPDPQFRDRLRREFRAGPLASRSPSPWRPWAVAATVLLMLGGATIFANRPAPWRLVAASDQGIAHIDGLAVDLASAVHRDVTLPPGAIITTDSNAELQIASEGTLVLVVPPDTTVEIPAVPGRWFGRSVRARIRSGELRGHTGPRFAGARLEIAMPDATVEISGTTFAVLANQEGSCVCVLEGSVRMAERTGSFSVDPGRRRIVPPDGGAPRDEPIRPMEAMKLEMLRDRSRALATPDRN